MTIDRVDLDQSKKFWIIYSSHWEAYVQRRGPETCSDPQLNAYERVICALCETLHSSQQQKGES